MLMIPEIGIVLAAGEGRRLKPHTDRLPKSLVPVAGISFLERALEALNRSPVTEVCLVTGYLEERIREFLVGSPFESKVHLCRNPRFSKGNNILSLGVALQGHPHRSFLLLDGDLLFDERLLSRLIDDPRPDLLVVDTDRRRLDEEAMKVVVADSVGVVTAIGKEIPVNRAAGEYIGMAKFSKPWAMMLLETFGRMSEQDGFEDLYYEDALHRILAGGEKGILEIMPVNDLPWAEVDTPDELEKVSKRWIR